MHLAIRLARTVSVAEFTGKVKSSSSLWLKAHISDFAWQRGYGAFTVSQEDLPALLRYVDNQEEHHRHQGFQDEYRGLLRRYLMPYDERYVWD